MSRDTSQHRDQLLKILADGKFHSGEDIGQALGLSRAAISKHVRFLGELGLDIFRVTGKGYRLSQPLKLLDEARLRGQLNRGFSGQLEIFSVVDSTNQHIKTRLAELSPGYTCLAEAQTAGRGRHGRKWVSPFGASLYLSMYHGFDEGYQMIGGLSLVIGVAIAKTIEEMGVIGCQLKWPNDVYLKGRKLAGILIEVEGQMEASCDCIIGIGLNVALEQGGEEIDQPWIDLSSVAGPGIDRNVLAANLINQLTSTLSRFQRHGLEPFIAPWSALDIYRDKPLQLTMGSRTFNGIGRGINDSGALLLEIDGAVKPFYGGEISVRPL